MDVSPHIEALQAEVAEVAAVGDEATAQAARRLSAALRSAIGVRLLDVLSQAAVELSGQLPSGHVEVRLAGQNAELVYVEEQAAEPAPLDQDGGTARMTLRLPESLKSEIEAAAARERVSVNTWLVRALARAVGGVGTSPKWGPGSRLRGFGQS